MISRAKMKYDVLIMPYRKDPYRMVQVTVEATNKDEAGKKAVEHIRWAHDGFDLVVQCVNEHTTESKGGAS